MREIKFRAWDKRRKKWLEPHYVDISCAGVISKVTVHRGYEIASDRNLDFIELMQYTGLKDKNGKEIYEGDIIEIRGQNYKYIAEIIWDDEKAGYDLKEINTSIPDYLLNMPELFVDRISQIKVIGNIYENPELLEGEIK